MKRIAWMVCGWFVLFAGAHAEYTLGAKYQVKNDALKFDTVELFMGGKSAGYIYGESRPIRFSENFYVYEKCPVDKSTKKPNGYCIDWHIYDDYKKSHVPLALPGLGFSSIPSFSWPYIAYVKVPKKITKKNFQEGVVDVSCVVVEWPTKRVVAQQEVKVNVGHFETDAPGSFYPPEFMRRDGLLNVACSEYNGKDAGNVIATVKIPG